MAVPNIFANVTTSIPLSQLDQNFATAITLGNTAVYLGNTTTTLGNLTLTNVNIVSGTSNIASTPTSIANGTSNVSVVSSGGNVVVSTNNATAITVDTGQRTKFPTTIGVGAATPSTSGSGITFPATQSASSEANTLDDYEEGTFTPILADNASVSNAATMTVQEGFYTKIGNTVTIQIQIVWTDKGSMGAGNNVRIYGIPFNSRTNTSQYYWPALISMSSGNTGFIAGQEGGGTAVTLEAVNNPNSELSTSYVSSSGRLLIQYTYRTA